MWELHVADLPAVPTAQADNMPGSYKRTKWSKEQWYHHLVCPLKLSNLLWGYKLMIRSTVLLFLQGSAV